MSGTALKDWIKNENIRGKLEVAPIENKMSETCLRWLVMYKVRPIDTTVRKIGYLEIIV